MSRFVLDASIVLNWCFLDEEQLKAREISERIARGDVPIVPAFWRHEVLNALLVGEKRKRITAEQITAFISDLMRLPVEVDATSAERIFETTRELCRKTQPDFIRCCLP